VCEKNCVTFGGCRRHNHEQRGISQPGLFVRVTHGVLR
jgi:hypothetical protein